MSLAATHADPYLVDEVRFRTLFRAHAGGVVVVTLDAGTGPAGFTASSFTSLSLDPPMAVFAIAHTASCWPHICAADSVVVHVLTAEEEPLATRFATSGIDRFAAPLRWRRLSTGEPLLDRQGPWLRGRIVGRVPAGDHDLVLLDVEDINISAARSALVHHDGRFHAIGTP